MILRAILLTLFLPYGTAFAQATLVRSGEHADFSRLVLEFDSRTVWDFGRVEGGYEFRAENAEARYLLEDAFDLIPRDRISTLRDMGDGRLFLGVSCQCHADVFDLRAAQVVIDIKDGAALAFTQRFEKELPAADAQQFANTRDDGPAPAPISVPALEARHGLPLFSPETGGADPLIAPAPTPLVEGTTVNETRPHSAPDFDTSDRPVDRVFASEMALVSQIGNAAALGLVEPDLTQTDALVAAATHPITRPTVPPPARPVGAAADPEATPPNGEPQSHVSIQTSVDRYARQTSRAPPTDAEGVLCLPDEYFDISQWGVPPGPGADLGLYRAQLLGEFDVPVAQSITRLAQYYIYLTFGAEAVTLTRRFASDLDHPDLLQMLGEIMDDGRAVNADHMVTQMSCDSRVALWAALSQAEFRPGQQINRTAVTAAFSSLPLHLRRHLGPDLAMRFLNAGDGDTAIALRNAIGRAEGAHGAPFELLEAQISLAQGNDVKGSDELARLVEVNDPVAAEALVDLIDVKIDSGGAIPQRVIEIASSLAFEQQGTAAGEVLVGAEIRARIHAADFAGALSVLSAALKDEEISQEHAASLRAEVIEQLMMHATDAQFLRYVVPGQYSDDLPPGLRHRVGERLLTLGFNAEARAVVAPRNSENSAQDKVFLARALVADGDLEAALSLLSGLGDQSASLTRAAALAARGDHPEAAQIYSALDLSERQLKEAWRAGDWRQVSETGSGPIGAAGMMMQRLHQGPQAPPAAAQNTPAQAQYLASLTESRQTRRMLDDLLAELALP